MDNLHFDKGGYFYELFFNRNRKYFPLCSHTVKKHVLKFGRSQNTENSVATLAMWGVGYFHLLVLPNFHLCFYNCMSDSVVSRVKTCMGGCLHVNLFTASIDQTD